MSTASKDALLSRRESTDSGFPEDEVEIPGLGSVRVRGLSRHEVIKLQSIKGVAAVERFTVSLGMLDPLMTEDEVGQWQKVSVGGELDPVTQKIGELSGMMRSSDKEAYKSVRDESGDGVGVLHSSEAGDDSESSSAGDVE